MKMNDKIPQKHNAKWIVLLASVLCMLSVTLLPVLAVTLPMGLVGAKNSVAMSHSSKPDQAAQKISELYRQLDELEKQKQELSDQIEAAKSDLTTTLQAKKLLDEQSAATETQIAALDDIIAEYDVMISEKQTRLEELGVAYNEKYELFLERLRRSYEEGTPSILEIFFYSESFIDILTSIERMNDILGYDEAFMNRLEEETRQLRAENRELVALRAEKEKAEGELVEKKAALDKQIEESTLYIHTLEENNASLEALLLQIEADEEATNIAIEAALAEFDKLTGALAASDPRRTKEYKTEHKKPSILSDMESGRLQKGSEYFADEADYIFPLAIPAYVADGRITSEFGWRTYTNSAGHTVTSNHGGIDICVPYNSPIYASRSGTVLTAEYSSSYGNYIVIVHDDGTQTRYAHCSSLAVKVGEYVLQGEQIAKVGSTGNATGNHCHFEVRLRENGAWVAYDPLKYVTEPK